MLFALRPEQIRVESCWLFRAGELGWLQMDSHLREGLEAIESRVLTGLVTQTMPLNLSCSSFARSDHEGLIFLKAVDHPGHLREREVDRPSAQNALVLTCDPRSQLLLPWCLGALGHGYRKNRNDHARQTVAHIHELGRIVRGATRRNFGIGVSSNDVSHEFRPYQPRPPEDGAVQVLTANSFEHSAR